VHAPSTFNPPRIGAPDAHSIRIPEFVHLLALDVMLVKPMMGRLPIVGNLDSLGLRLQKQTLHLLTVNRVPAVVVSIIAAPRRQDRRL